MTRSIGVQIGLLAFGMAVVSGLYVGNSATVILTRALVAMILGLILGQMAGWGVKSVLRDHLQRKKLNIDREHLAASRALTGEALVVEEVIEEELPESSPAPAEAG